MPASCGICGLRQFQRVLSLAVMGYGEIIIKNPDVASPSVRHCVVVSQGGQSQCESWAFAMCHFA